MAARNKKESTLKTKTEPVQIVKPEPRRTLLEWEAPVRPFKKRSREYFSTLGAIVLLLVIIMLFLKEWTLILVMIALSFVVYVLGTIPPAKTKHQINSLGIITGDKRYLWNDLSRFWLEDKWEQTLLYVRTSLRFPRVLIMLLGEASKDQVKKILSNYLLFEEPEPTWMDKTSGWLSRNIPLEKEN